ncbi:MAG: alpha/beta fold hydrolase [Alphaproteobacteria bacterium]
MQQHYIDCLSTAGFHKMAYVEWGAENKNAVVCVHGLTRNGRDFDFLSRELMSDYRIICPDIVGRGKSDWLPEAYLYNFPQYLADLTALMARLNVASVDWVGTSMGGVLGMLLAAQPHSPIRRLVMNDVGPQIPASAAKRIADYAGKSLHFDSLEQVEAHFRKIYGPFGELRDEHWAHIAKYSAKELDDGGYTCAYDPNIIIPPVEGAPDIDLWDQWAGVKCPVLVLRGETSDILTKDTLEQMKATHNNITAVEVADVAHAPALMEPSQIDIITRWMRDTA